MYYLNDNYDLVNYYTKKKILNDGRIVYEEYDGSGVIPYKVWITGISTAITDSGTIIKLNFYCNGGGGLFENLIGNDYILYNATNESDVYKIVIDGKKPIFVEFGVNDQKYTLWYIRINKDEFDDIKNANGILTQS